ncbi:hypothetical protein BDW75DRAFT_40502 [Aspergillus navahoensis]
MFRDAHSRDCYFCLETDNQRQPGLVQNVNSTWWRRAYGILTLRISKRNPSIKSRGLGAKDGPTPLDMITLIFEELVMACLAIFPLSTWKRPSYGLGALLRDVEGYFGSMEKFTKPTSLSMQLEVLLGSSNGKLRLINALLHTYINCIAVL